MLTFVFSLPSGTDIIAIAMQQPLPTGKNFEGKMETMGD